MKELTGEALYNAYATTNPHVLEWKELFAETQKRLNDTAQVLDKQLHYGEICHLLEDYRAHVEKITAMFTNRNIDFVSHQLAERGASCGLWPSRESEEES